MNKDSYRVTIRHKAKERLAQLLDSRRTAMAIHYSCESFYGRPNGGSPRITSIAVRSLENGQATSFSIHQMAEIEGVAFPEIELRYNGLERIMLDQFYRYVENHRESLWVHWNMRDINYGFPAIAHRYRVLGGNPLDIHESRLIDLARLFIDLFGVSYAGHPRLESIIAINEISDKDLIGGDKEAEAFEKKEYLKIHQSTLRKVDIFENLITRLANGSIKTNATWRDKYGGVFGATIEFLREHWLITLISLIGTILGIWQFFGDSKNR